MWGKVRTKAGGEEEKREEIKFRCVCDVNNGVGETKRGGV